MEIQEERSLLAEDRRDSEYGGLHAESRSTLRRPTLATVVPEDSDLLDEGALATNLSADGAFVRSRRQPPENTRFVVDLRLPISDKLIRLKAKVVRRSELGVGLRFEEVSARDRSRLRSYSGYYDTDEAIVRIQQSLGDLVPGNLLPFSDESEVCSILEAACSRGVEVKAVLPGRAFRPTSCRIIDVQMDKKDAVLGRSLFRLGGFSSPLPRVVRTVYLTFSLPPLYYMCEALVSDSGPTLELLLPERIYISERRSQLRATIDSVWLELPVPHLSRMPMRIPVLDLTENGCSVRLAASAMWLPGTRLPSLGLVTDKGTRSVAGATVQYVRRAKDGWLRAGLQFEQTNGDRRVFEAAKRGSARSSVNILKSLSFLKGRITGLVRGRSRHLSEDPEIVRYRNRRGDTVAAVIDATFETANYAGQPDVAVVIAPAILKRKEAFGLFAQTILDNLNKHDLSGVVLRFDASHVVGESTMDPQLEAEGRPYYNWTLGHLRDDMAASISYLERRFRPKHRALVSVSLSAIPARKIVTAGSGATVDIWIAPFGCPDAQDMVRNYLAGLDHFSDFEQGRAPESVMIHGRPISSEALYGGALAEGMAYLEEAREDMASIDAPVCWILGKHDHWVTHSRVRAMLEAPGPGAREVFELPTGHVLKGGSEAIELFKLVSETLLKHLFKIDCPAVDPDLGWHGIRSHAEWRRVKKSKLGDSKAFWRTHLFGDEEDGYDILLDHPEYPRFLRQQVDLLDPKPHEDLADLGCGTGNLSVEILKTYKEQNQPNSLTYVDLVPEAVKRTESKVVEYCSLQRDLRIRHRGISMDLEVSRLAPVRDFLEGRIWSLEELAGRIEGLDRRSARAIQESYGKELHGILRGRPATNQELRKLAPNLSRDEVETVQDLSLASRFLNGSISHRDFDGEPATVQRADQLAFQKLCFGASSSRIGYEFPEGSFDKVGASLLMPYLFDPLAFLREVHRVLRPGGVMVASSIVPNFDPSKTYLEAAEIIRRSAGPSTERKLAALRHYGNMIGRLIELEEDGRFHFYGAEALCALAEEAGFSEVRTFPAFGRPPTTIIIRAQK